MAKRHHLRDAVDAQLRRTGSDIETFLRDSLAMGKTPRDLVGEIFELTAIQVSFRSLYRWIDALEDAA